MRPLKSLTSALAANLAAVAKMFEAPSFPQFHPIELNQGVRRVRGLGWTHAQVQRMARKKRNQAKNRKSQRG
jgi:hypothetical protein